LSEKFRIPIEIDKIAIRAKKLTAELAKRQASFRITVCMVTTHGLQLKRKKQSNNGKRRAETKLPYSSHPCCRWTIWHLVLNTKPKMRVGYQKSLFQRLVTATSVSFQDLADFCWLGMFATTFTSTNLAICLYNSAEYNATPSLCGGQVVTAQTFKATYLPT
jgi:hypothetical protein